MATIKVRRDISSDWAKADPILAEGEPGYEINKYKLKIGDGSTAWSVLNYYGETPRTFNPTQTRQYTGTTAGGRQGSRPLISGTRNIIDNGGDNTLKIYTASTGVLERTITSPNAGDASYYGFAADGAVTADDTFVVTSENYQVPATNSRIRIYNISDGTLVGTLLRATVANDSSDNTVDGMTFGRVMAIKDNCLLVSNTEHSESVTGEGIVYVYETTNRDWSNIALAGTIAPAGPVTDGNYGCSLDISDYYAAIGHRGNSSGTVDIVNINTRALIATIAHPAGGSNNELFGNTVRFIGRNGDYLAVGAPGQSASAGSVYIFKTTNGYWTDSSLVSTINNPNAYNDAVGDQFGLKVSGTSDFLTIAASHEDNQAEGNFGAGGPDWTQTTLDGTLVGTPSQSGVRGSANIAYKGAISSNGAFIASGHEGAWTSQTSSSYTGEVKLIDTSNNTVVQTFQNPNGIDDAYFGSGIAVNSTITAIGAFYEPVSGRNRQGRVYIFNNSTGALVTTINSPQSGSNIHFGASLAMDETHLVIGEPAQSGSSRIYLYSADTSGASLVWTYTDNVGYKYGDNVAISDSYVVGGTNNDNRVVQLNRSNGSVVRTYQDSAGEGTEQLFGRSLSITDDYLAIGSAHYRKEYQGPGVGNYRSGRVYIYDPSNGNLIRTIENPNSTGTIWGDSFGYAVSVSGDYLLASARDERYGSDEVGTGYIIDLTDGSTTKTLTSTNPVNNSRFGEYVAISDAGKFVIGAYGEGTGSQGRLYIYEAPLPSLGTEAGVNYIYSTTSGDWTDASLAATLPNPELTVGGGDGLTAIDMYADRLLAGYTLAEDGATTNVGRVYEYSLYD